MSIQENCRVVENTRLGEGLYLMVLDAPEIVKLTQCGQFVHIACGEGHLLRRPISICTWQGSHLRIVFQVKGDGTKWLSERKVGDVLDVLGPLGHGFDVQALGDRPIFIGGGIGVPPMLGCVRTAVEKGAQPAAILGFRNEGAVILEGDFRDECETFVTTDDGTYARHGFVTDVLKEQVAGATGVCEEAYAEACRRLQRKPACPVRFRWRSAWAAASVPVWCARARSSRKTAKPVTVMSARTVRYSMLRRSSGNGRFKSELLRR